MSGGFTVNLYLSRKRALASKQRPFQTIDVPSLAAGANTSFRVRTSRSGKQKYLLATIDSSGSVSENDENNNSVVGALR